MVTPLDKKVYHSDRTDVSPKKLPPRLKRLNGIVADYSNARKDLPNSYNMKEKLSLFLLKAQQRHLRILVTGKTGQGKYTLIKKVLRLKEATEGASATRCTTEVTEYSKTNEGAHIKMFDSSGLQDRTDNEEEYIRGMREKCQELSLILYCTKMTNTRLTDDDKNAMIKLTAAFGENFWDYSVFVLTFANKEDVEIKDDRDKDEGSEPDDCDEEGWKELKKRRFEGRLRCWEQNIHQFLIKEVKVESNIVVKIPIVPIGDTKQSRRNRYPFRLPDRENWFTSYWQTCRLRVKETRLFLKINSSQKVSDDHQRVDDKFDEKDSDKDGIELNFQKAMKSSGLVKSHVTKVLIQGEARVGKTSVKCMIVSETYNDKSSTGCIEAPSVAIHNTDEEKELLSCYEKKERHWTKVTDEEMEEKVTAVLHLNALEMSKSPTSATITSQFTTNNDGTITSDDSSTQEGSITTTLISDTHSNEYTEEISVANDEEHSEIASTIDTTASNIAKVRALYDQAKRNHQGKDSNVLNDQHWLYFIDSGGQIQFQKLLPAFMPCASIVILVVSLAKNLRDAACQDYEDSKGQTLQTNEHPMAVEEVLKQLFSEVSSIAQQHKSLISEMGLSEYIKPPTKSVDKLKIVTVATFCDKYKEGEVESRQEKIEKLTKYFDILSKTCDPVQEKGCVKLFEINGSNATKSDYCYEVVQEVAKLLGDNAYEINVPLRWYCFEILLHGVAKEGCGVLSLQECQLLGFELSGMSPEEVKSALQFLHFLNKILYYPNSRSASDLVFVQVESLINIIKELVEFACYSSSGKLKYMRKFLQEGKLAYEILKELDSFKKIENKFEDFGEKLLDLLCYLLIATTDDKVDSKGSYILPALLPITNVSCVIDKINVDLFFSVPLLFYYKSGVPMGLFCALIVQLLSSQESTWLIIKGSPNYSNLFNMRLQEGSSSHEVILVEQLHSIEVYSTTPKTSMVDTIERELVKTMQKHRLKLSDKPIAKAFKCPCTCKKLQKDDAALPRDHEAPPRDHVAEIKLNKDGRGYYFKCKLSNEDPPKELKDYYQLWFTEEKDSDPTHEQQEIAMMTKGASVPQLHIGKRQKESISDFSETILTKYQKRDSVFSHTTASTETFIDTTELVDVIEILEKRNFFTTKWRRLGLRLGLYGNTLDTIEANKQNVEDCLEKCLDSWLKKMDGVMKKGGPSWKALASALNKIEEMNVANHIEQTKLD